MRRQRGHSKFEVALVAALFAALVAIGLNRLHVYQQRAETVAAQQLVVHLRTALSLKMSQLTAAQRQPDMRALVDQNPIEWLSERPKNYLGEYYSPDNTRLATGNWYFDRGSKTLVYLSTQQDSFAPHALILLRFKVESNRLPLSPSTPAHSAVIANVALVQIIEPTGAGGQ